MKDDALKKSILTLAVIALTVPGVALAQDAGTPDKDQVVKQPTSAWLMRILGWPAVA